MFADDNNNDNRGFASMDPEKQKEIASKGGKESHKND
ncbi:MAG: KGG domain-containing protein [Candidatus Doudnabacteria bacterium]|nr:KGG domain-containing protein [Candidatus Doudnabacteria bacterium]